ncbi:lycopene cyclase domain-containing protein [Sphingobacterium sp. BIGb0165]|uniref:lycopene cyclase domain-containing protein n=1 Tax=Sphingobacterium sp. BIGb0165 TaxID=2940615 RepID=UPI0021676DAF|nr:lycopene cyclase domain-containing protein [Sphingobacterium sp. BIGb0165]MCS4227019.1 lycopene cyclase domain-containing protein [Sphingobacterium sp. BIGb0165]
MMQYTYSLILFFTVIICFVASFDKRLRFDREFVPFLKASVIVALFFIAWDVWFTSRGVWWFNTKYTLGIVLAGLPLEEWLFFIFIPFSCVFTYFCLDKFFRWQHLSAFNNITVFVSIIVCAVVALRYADRIYTLVTAVVTIVTLLLFHFVMRVQWISQASLVFTVLMLGFLPVNGILTGTGLQSPIVNYNPADFMGIRVLTIPIEDAVYGYTQFLWVLYFFKKFQTRAHDPNS